MLRLERMEIAGFKSFSDRTEVRFQGGVTAVVGPNGCGKSNIGDALNWVLGEQSPKLLRGKHMADVIFNGTRSRKPLGMAEVSLHLVGAEGLPHAENGQVSITRRLFRSGESDYLINGHRARLKDIQELLREARIGSKTYATIEQGKVDQVLNAKPRDRRLIIEDAAGVSGYKHKRRLTELKLEATQANLLRVNDIVVEVRRQINSMKRQAAKARRYQKLRDELRANEQVHYALRARTLDEELTRFSEDEAAARDRESETAATLARLETETVELRGALEQASRAYREAAEGLHRLELEIDRDEREIQACKERISDSRQASERYTAEAQDVSERRAATGERAATHESGVSAGRAELERLVQVHASHQSMLEGQQQEQAALRQAIEDLRRRQFEHVHQTSELRNRRRSLEESLERNRQQATRIETERASARDDHSRLDSQSSELAASVEESQRVVAGLTAEATRIEEELRQARAEQAVETESLAQAREREQSAQARLGTLEDVATRFAGVSDGVRMLLSSGAGSGLRPKGVVADFVEAGTDVEAAAESYLGGLLPAVILQSDEDVTRAAAYLRGEGAGRTSFISATQPAGALAVGMPQNGRARVPETVLADSRVIGRLRDRVSLKTSANGVLADRIGDAILVENLQAALELHRSFPGADYLTLEGEVVYASGVISTGGKGAGDQGLLAHNRRMHEARQVFDEASAVAGELQRRVEQLRTRVTDLEAALPERRRRLETAQRRHLELEHETRRSEEDRERTRRRTQVLADELSNLDEEAERLTVALTELSRQVDGAEGEAGAIDRQLSEQSAELEQHEGRTRELADRVAGLRADLAASRERQEALEHEGRRLSEAAEELASRVSQLEARAHEERERASEASERLTSTESALVDRLEQRKIGQEKNAEMERSIAERQQELSQREERLRASRIELEGHREKTREVEVDRARAESARQHLDELCNQELGMSAAAAAAAVGESMPEDADLATLESEIERLKGRLDQMGPVNLAAVEEFSELEQRHAFLTEQRDDLESSMTALRDTIRRINRQSRDRFMEAFEAIRASFQEIFTLLFNGGRADLRLEEGEDVLECGIEIMAQPPGKRLTSVQLLSGGEKALSAVALLFAVFRYQPSPFCLLDEVDAPLDDSNVGRFTRMIREYAANTQFVIITHNKLSMEAADLIYGVTMEEAGVSSVMSMQMQ